MSACKRARNAQSFGEFSKLPDVKEHIPRARTPTIPHRAYLATAQSVAARTRDKPSAWLLSPAAHLREDGLREARTSLLGVRLRLRENRRGVVLGNYPAPSPRRVDRSRSDGGAAGDGPRSLRQAHRPTALCDCGHRDSCITKAPSCGGEKAGRSPVDRGKQGIKRSAIVDAKGTSRLEPSQLLQPIATIRRFWTRLWTPWRRCLERATRADERAPGAWL